MTTSCRRYQKRDVHVQKRSFSRDQRAIEAVNRVGPEVRPYVQVMRQRREILSAKRSQHFMCVRGKLRFFT